MALNLQEFEMAVVCAFSMAHTEPKSDQDRALKQQATAFCEKVKTLPDAWKHNFQLFTSATASEAKFYGLQTLQELLVKGMVSEIDRSQLRLALLEWLQTKGLEMQTLPAFVKNKIAVVLCHLIKVDFPERWSTAFGDLQALCSRSTDLVDMFLRVLRMMEDDIVAFNEQRGAAEIQHNTLIKDTMRSTSTMADIFELFFNVLVSYRSSRQELCTLCLETMQSFIGWADVGLIANDRFIPLLFTLLADGDLREDACSCLEELVSKGMEEQKKFELLRQLNILEVLRGLRIDDVDFAESVGGLVNIIGMELIQCAEAFEPDGEKNELAAKATEMLKEALPLIFTLFGHEEIGVSSELFGTVNSLINDMKRQKGHPLKSYSLVFSEIIEKIFGILLQRIRYPEGFDYEAVNSEEHAAREEYRSALRKVFVNTTRIYPEKILSLICATMGDVLPRFRSIGPPDQEAALYFVHHFGEGLTTANLQSLVREGPFPELISAIHQCILGSGPALHHSVLLVYHDITVRYSKVLKSAPGMIPAVLEGMFGPLGLSNHNPTVRSRVCYLLTRLCKQLGGDIQPFAESVLRGIEPQLVVPQVTQKNVLLTFEDQLYLFELAGQMIAINPSESVQLQYLQIVLGRLAENLDAALHHPALKTDPEAIGLWMSRIIAAMGHVSKAFKSVPEGLCPIFIGVVEKAVMAHAALPTHDAMRSKILFFFHRMIGILGAKFIPFAQVPVVNLLTHMRPNNALEIFHLINQLVITYKVFAIVDGIFLPLVQKVADISQLGSSALHEAQVEARTEEEAEKVEVQRTFYLFLYHLCSNDLSPLLVSPTNWPNFGPILSLLAYGCKDVPDLQANKTCFTIARSILEAWFKPGDALQAAAVTVSEQAKTAYAQFVYQEATPAVFVCLRRKHFDVNDIQAIGCMKEMSLLLKRSVNIFGSEYVRYLSEICSSAAGCPPNVASTFAARVQQAVDKDLMLAMKELAKGLTKS